jgi:hypothetical protein
MRRRLFLVGLAASLGSSAAYGQADWVTQILQAAQLPVIAAEARAEGMPSTDIGTIIEAVRQANIPAQEAALILDTARVIRREQGPIDNFGAFVQSQLASGKRGKDLAAAIRAEHVRQGKGRGNANARGGRASQTPGNQPAGGNARGGTAGRGRGGPPTREPETTT